MIIREKIFCWQILGENQLEYCTAFLQEESTVVRKRDLQSSEVTFLYVDHCKLELMNLKSCIKFLLHATLQHLSPSENSQQSIHDPELRFAVQGPCPPL